MHIFEAGGHHELKYGWHFEGTSFDQDRYYSGPLGERGLARHYNPGTPTVWTFFTLQGNEQPYQFGSHPYDLLGADYKNDLQAHISNFISSFFASRQLLAAAKSDDQRRRALRDAEDV